MKHLSLALIFAFLSHASLGQDSVRDQDAQGQACFAKANSQNAMDQCASEEAKRFDLALNTLYTSLLVKTSSDAVATDKVKIAERAWIKYRDAYIEATYPAQNKQAAYGSTFPMDGDLLRVKLTREHIKALTDLLDEYSRN